MLAKILDLLFNRDLDQILRSFHVMEQRIENLIQVRLLHRDKNQRLIEVLQAQNRLLNDDIDRAARTKSRLRDFL